MAGDKWSQVKQILDEAIRQKPEERAAFLDKACDGDDGVRREVESLLSSFGKADGFMEKPALGHAGREVTEEMTPLPTGLAIGHYEIIRELGTGGMGIVYLAKDKNLDRHVAIKVLNKKYEQHEENVRRFVHEAKAASALNHPNILTIHEIGEFEGSQYIVSEHVEGETLREILGKGRLDLDRVVDISIQTASALAAAHKARIIHRDIKPENIIVREDGYLKVLDFGLAKLLPSQVSTIGLDDKTKRQNETEKGVILGTVSYMSPEQAKGEPVDERTDIFSFGVVMYEMISGRTPFAGSSTPETFANLINKQPAPLERYVPEVPGELSNIVARMLEKDRGDRCQTMIEVIADLKSFKDGDTGSDRKRISSPNEENLTKTLPHTTREAIKDAGRTSGFQRPSVWRVALLTLVPLALIAAAVAAWFLYPTNPHPQIKTLAVLPLKSLDSKEDVLGLGIADAVIRRISQTGALTVRPTSSVRRYLIEDTDALTAARELLADAVLEGSVQRGADRLRVSVNLLRTSDGASLWAESFDMRAADIFTIQDTVAQQVATRLRLQLDPEQQARLGKRSTSNPIAYEYYVKGVNSLDQRGFGPKAKPQMDATIDLFKRAVEADPNYALARAQLAYSYIFKALFIVPDEQATLAALAKEQLNLAEAIDPQLAELHATRSWFLFSGYEGYQTEGAARGLLIAQQLNPNVGHTDLGSSYYHMGLEDLAEREYLKALEIDPTSEFVKNQFVLFYYYMARWDDYFTALQKYQPGLALDPDYLVAKGRLEEAEKVINAAATSDPDDRYVPINRARVYAARGEYEKADELNAIFVKSLDKRVPSYHHDIYAVACVYAMIGKTDEAMKWLRESAATGFSAYTTFERDSFLDKIRQSPEFIQFMAEMKELYEKRRSEFK